MRKLFSNIKATVKAVVKFGSAVAALATAQIGRVFSAAGCSNIVNKIFGFGDKLAAFATC